MALGDRVFVNGYVHSWTSIEIVVANVIYCGFTSVSFDDKRERSLVYGVSRSGGPRGMTSGKYTPSPAKLAGTIETMAQLRQALAAKAQATAPGMSYAGVGFNIQVHVSEFGSPPISYVVQNCHVSSASNSYQEGTDALMEEWELFCTGVLRDGLSLKDAALV